MQTFTQHELEIIQGHQQFSKSEDLKLIKREVETMLTTLESEAGKQLIEDDAQRHYTFKNYLSVSKKLATMSQQEFQQIDFSMIDELK